MPEKWEEASEFIQQTSNQWTNLCILSTCHLSESEQNKYISFITLKQTTSIFQNIFYSLAHWHKKGYMSQNRINVAVLVYSNGE